MPDELSFAGNQPVPVLSPATLRRLVQMADVPQIDIAREMGVSQPRLSECLRQHSCTRRVADSVLRALAKLQAAKRGN
jgi:predicted DNA-binding protein (UPF0251 family)